MWQLIGLVQAMSTDTMAFECHTLTVAGCVLERGGRVMDVVQVAEVVHKVAAGASCRARVALLKADHRARVGDVGVTISCWQDWPPSSLTTMTTTRATRTVVVTVVMVRGRVSVQTWRGL